MDSNCIFNKYKIKINKILCLYLITISNSDIRSIVDYALEGGKRLRPMIIYDISKKIDLPEEICNNLILGIELLHNASLILDDMPNMDNDDYRRDKKTVHNKYGMFKAKVVANFLFFEALRLFSYYQNNNLVSFRRIIKLMNYVNVNNCSICLGQYYDLSLNSSINNLKQHELINLLNLKTVPLFVISFISSHVIKNYNDNELFILEKCGIDFGYIFQICDDFEDEEKDDKIDKLNNHIKIIGKDASYNLFIDKRDSLIDHLKKLDLYSNFFKELVNLLNKKISRYNQ